METIFTNASRKKYRFNYKGVITTEDLWDLSLKDLDSIYKSLRKQEKVENEEESLLTTKTAADTELSEKIAIVKFIVQTKQEEPAGAMYAKAKADRRQEILAVIDSKKKAALDEMSIEDLSKMLED